MNWLTKINIEYKIRVTSVNQNDDSFIFSIDAVISKEGWDRYEKSTDILLKWLSSKTFYWISYKEIVEILKKISKEDIIREYTEWVDYHLSEEEKWIMSEKILEAIEKRHKKINLLFDEDEWLDLFDDSTSLEIDDFVLWNDKNDTSAINYKLVDDELDSWVTYNSFVINLNDNTIERKFDFVKIFHWIINWRTPFFYSEKWQDWNKKSYLSILNNNNWEFILNRRVFLEFNSQKDREKTIYISKENSKLEFYVFDMNYEGLFKKIYEFDYFDFNDEDKFSILNSYKTENNEFFIFWIKKKYTKSSDETWYIHCFSLSIDWENINIKKLTDWNNSINMTGLKENKYLVTYWYSKWENQESFRNRWSYEVKVYDLVWNFDSYLDIWTVWTYSTDIWRRELPNRDRWANFTLWNNWNYTIFFSWWNDIYEFDPNTFEILLSFDLNDNKWRNMQPLNIIWCQIKEVDWVEWFLIDYTARSDWSTVNIFIPRKKISNKKELI